MEETSEVSNQNRSEEIGERIAPHLPSLRRYLYTMFKGDTELSEDSLQEGLLRVISRYESFEGKADFRTWVFAICRNAALDIMRGRYRRRDSAVLTPEAAELLASSNPGPEELVVRDELRATVVDALMDLPEKFRVPLMLKEMEDISVNDIAQILDIPEGTVKSRLSTGRRKLARRFNQLYPGGEDEIR